MKIHHIRNATLVIEVNDKFVLVDPMLGAKGSMPPFTFFRFKPKRNPIVALPEASKTILKKVTHCLITHLHPDHLDKEAEKFLKEKGIPVSCSIMDEKKLRKKGLKVAQTVSYWQKTDFLGGIIEGIPARHGYGFTAKLGGNVMGYYIQLPNQPSLYLSSDTIYTEAVHKVLTEYKPEISVVAAGSAQFDLFKPLLMTVEDVVKFVENSSYHVIANHLEAVNHCPTTRKDLRSVLEVNGLSDHTYIPEDGEVMKF